MKRTKGRVLAIGVILLLLLAAITECKGFAAGMPRGLGLVWLPLVMLFFERIGAVTTRMYLAYWRLAIVAICIMAAILAPPDPWSVFVLALLVTLLYFCGVALCKWMPHRLDSAQSLGRDVTAVAPTPQLRPYQFSLRRLLLWTAVWALYLGLLKLGRVSLLGGAALTVYFGIIFAIRIRWGYERGSVWTSTVTSALTAFLIVCQNIVHLITSPSFWSDVFRGLLPGLFIFGFLGFVLGLIAFWIVHWLVRFVDWVDKLMEGKSSDS